MKKSLLFACVAGLVLSAGAQNRTTKQVVSIKDNHRQAACTDLPTNSAPTSFAPVQRKTPKVITNATVADIELGWANNALGGYTRPSRSICYADPGLNAVIVTHRSAPNCNPSDGTATSGSYMFDYSKDGGKTWNPAPSFGPVFDAGTELARYPNGLIYNPAGNADPDKAYIACYGPCTGPTMAAVGLWIAHANGAATLGNPATTANQATYWYDSTVNYIGLIPDVMVITQTGNTWVVDETADGSANYTYQDTLIVQKGTWNSTTKIFDYATTLLPFPVIKGAINGTSIAFAPNGLTGYIVATGNDDLTISSDTSNYLMVQKTTDGGATWGPRTAIPVSAAAGLALGDTGIYNALWAPDASVDKNGNLYIAISMFQSAGTQGINIAPGSWGQFAVYTKDGGATWKFKLLDTPSTYKTGPTTGASPITEYTRGQISTNWACDKMAFIWFDTDTNSFPGGGNTNPDALGMFYDVNTDSWGPKVNLTAGTAADALLQFGDVSYYMLPGTGSNYKIPLSYQVLTGTDESVCARWHYVDGVEMGPVYTALNVTNTPDGCPTNGSGSASISVTGGTGTLSYLWTPGGQTTATATGLAGGTYQVVVTDANGISANTSTFIANAGVSATITANTSVSCFGGSNGSATASLTSGTGPFTFVWNTTPVQSSATATGLAVGTYTVTGTTANGCSNKTTATITQPAAVAITNTVTNATTCNGTDGSSMAVVTGGTGPYMYSWNTTPVQTTATATGLAGDYTVTVTDVNTCSAMTTVNVPQTAIALTTTVTVPVTCFNNKNAEVMGAVSNANGGTAPYTYAWSTTPAQTTTTVTGIGAGTYSVVVTSANGCTSVGAIAVTQPAALSVALAPNPGACSTCGSANATPSGGTGPFTYSWSPGGQTTQGISGLTAGIYTVCVTDAHNCSKCTAAAVNSAVNEITNNVFSISNAYPNPSSGISTFEITMKKSDNIAVEVSNMLGQVIYTSNANLATGTHKFTVDTSKWNAGIYFYTVKSTEFSVTNKLIRE